MLVLTRKKNQKIVIGENVVVTVLQVKGNSIQLGIEAPREVRILRGELEAIASARSDNPAPAGINRLESVNVSSGSPFESIGPYSSATVIGPTKMTIPAALGAPSRFPSVIKQEKKETVPAPPLKRYMPATMREVVGNVSV